MNGPALRAFGLASSRPASLTAPVCNHVEFCFQLKKPWARVGAFTNAVFKQQSRVNSTFSWFDISSSQKSDSRDRQLVLSPPPLSLQRPWAVEGAKIGYNLRWTSAHFHHTFESRPTPRTAVSIFELISRNPPVLFARHARSYTTEQPKPTPPSSSVDRPNPSSSKSELSSTATTSPPSRSSQPTSPQPETPEPAPNHSHIFEKLPNISQHLHRPTKEELLGAATGAWSRFKVRFKWFSIKSARPFNVDDISAFFSWILLGHFVWIIVGTTTFFSLAIFLVNTVFAQETLARWVGNYLTQASGLRVVFESAIVPKWGDGVISFKRVFVSCRPGQGQSRVSKGSQASALAAAAALAEKGVEAKVEEENTNYTQYDLSIDTVNVTLSFAKWFNGKGLLRDVEVIGVRGVVDRTSVLPAEPGVDPSSYRHEHNPGDFELDSFRLEDLLVTVYQPGGFRPFPVSIYSCELPRLRKQWLFYDFLNASTMHGSYDNSLFTIHPRQDETYTGVPMIINGSGVEPTGWRKQNRIRIDGLSIDHLNHGAEGTFSWIREGEVDVVADLLFPDDDGDTFAKVMSDFYDRVEATVISTGFSAMNPSDDGSMMGRHGRAERAAPQSGPRRASGVSEAEIGEEKEGADGWATGTAAAATAATSPEPEPQMVIEMRMSLNNVRAAVPLFSKEMSYVNNALVRPIVAYINSHRNFVPINCRLTKPVRAFDGSWTMYDSGLMDDLAVGAYDAFVRNLTDDEEARRRRFRKVGIWTLQLAAQALFLGLAGQVA